jgi:hypothetical protein
VPGLRGLVGGLLEATGIPAGSVCARDMDDGPPAALLVTFKVGRDYLACLGAIAWRSDRHPHIVSSRETE